MIQNCIDCSTKFIGDIDSKHGNYETHLHNVLRDILKGKYVYWDADSVDGVRYMRIDGLGFKRYGDEIEVLLNGASLSFDWGGGPVFASDTTQFLSYISKINKSLTKLHVIGFDELCKLVEKHVPFMLQYIRKLSLN
jgi:hypothetical protein